MLLISALHLLEQTIVLHRANKVIILSIIAVTTLFLFPRGLRKSISDRIILGINSVGINVILLETVVVSRFNVLILLI